MLEDFKTYFTQFFIFLIVMFQIMVNNVLSISEVPSEARNLGEGVARTRYRYTLLSECDSTVPTEKSRESDLTAY